jgi:Ca2+-dependent lipid-binding protein
VDEILPQYNAAPKLTGVAFQVTTSGKELARVDLLSKSDPYFVVSKNGQVIYKSEHLKNTHSPCWKPFILDVMDVGGNYDDKFKVAVWDHDEVSTICYILAIANSSLNGSQTKMI